MGGIVGWIVGAVVGKERNDDLPPSLFKSTPRFALPALVSVA